MIELFPDFNAWWEKTGARFVEEVTKEWGKIGGKTMNDQRKAALSIEYSERGIDLIDVIEELRLENRNLNNKLHELKKENYRLGEVLDASLEKGSK